MKKKKAGKEINPVEKTWESIGGIATFDTELKESIFIYRAIVGGIATVIFAWIGNKIFK